MKVTFNSSDNDLSFTNDGTVIKKRFKMCHSKTHRFGTHQYLGNKNFVFTELNPDFSHSNHKTFIQNFSRGNAHFEGSFSQFVGAILSTHIGWIRRGKVNFPKLNTISQSFKNLFHGFNLLMFYI